jgi:hypothetical protein
MCKHELRFMVLCIVLSFTSASVRVAAQGSSELPAHDVADANAAPVTGRNLLASERFWPYQVALTRPWQPAGRAEPLVPGIAGVLIRVENGGNARIDFGRDGLFEVPIEATDLLANANRIRRGELDKLAANFVLDIGPRLVDSGSETLRPFGVRAAGERSGFLCVFADPSAAGFADLAAALAPLRDRERVLTILFAQGSHPDAALRERLRSLDWPIPFMLDHMSEPYTRSLLPEGTPLPAVLLLTREGRVLFQSRFEPGVMPALTAALNQAFGDRSQSAGSR